MLALGIFSESVNMVRNLVEKFKTLLILITLVIINFEMGDVGVSAFYFQQNEQTSDRVSEYCLVDSNGEFVCSVCPNTFMNKCDEQIDEENIVDLTTQPWLVERSNLPPSHPAYKREHMIWADSCLWTVLEDIFEVIPVEKWLTREPTNEDLVGKYVLIEMWATWCPPCRRSLPYLDFIAKKYSDNLAVVAICEMDENAIRNMPGEKINVFDIGFFLAVDTGRRLANKIGVYGIPHAILLEPTIGGIVWEGMPTLPNYELDDKKLERFFAIGGKLKKIGKVPNVSPVKFKISEPTQEERASRHYPSTKPDVGGDWGLPST